MFPKRHSEHMNNQTLPQNVQEIMSQNICQICNLFEVFANQIQSAFVPFFSEKLPMILSMSALKQSCFVTT